MRPLLHTLPSLSAPLSRLLWVAVVASQAGCASSTGATGVTGAAGSITPARVSPPPGQAAPKPLTPAERAEAEARTAWPARWTVEGLGRSIAAWERAAELVPTAAGPHVRLAEARLFEGDALLARDRQPEAARKAFEAAMAAAERAEALGGGDVATYWRALAMSRAAAQIDYAQIVLVQDRVLHVMQRLSEAGSTVDHGGPDRYLGAYYARPPSYSERDLERSEAHFARALQADAAHLPTRVSRAQSYAVAAQDRSAFEAEIRAVLEADAAHDPQRQADAALAQTRAQTLLESAPDLFE